MTIREEPLPSYGDDQKVKDALRKMLQDQVDYAKTELAEHAHRLAAVNKEHDRVHTELLDAMERRGYLEGMIDRARRAADEAGVTLEI